AAFTFGCRLDGTASRTLAILCTQQRCSRLSGNTSRSAPQKPRAPSPIASTGALQVVENWNSANGFIHYGKSGEFASNRREDQELSMLSLHLLQISLVYVNTLMIQQVLGE